MNTVRIEFTAGQRAALLWRLEQGDLIAEVFADTGDLEDLSPAAEARADELAHQLTTQGYIDARMDSMDREILCEAVAGTTYLSSYDPRNNTGNTPQGLAAARRVLAAAWERIALAYGLSLDEIELPEA